jgi:hypothetical protein
VLLVYLFWKYPALPRQAAVVLVVRAGAVAEVVIEQQFISVEEVEVHIVLRGR